MTYLNKCDASQDLVGHAPQERPDERPGKMAFVPRILLTLVVVHAQIVAIQISTTTAVQISFGIFMGAVDLFALHVITRGRGGRPRMPSTLSLWLILMTLELVQFPLRVAATSRSQALVDYLVTSLPVAATIVVGRYLTTEARRERFILIAALGGVAGGYLAWILNAGQSRFQNPVILAIVTVWALAFHPPISVPSGRRERYRLLGVAAAFALIPVILASRSRTAFIIWVLAASCAYFLPRPNAARVFKAAIVASAGICVTLLVPGVSAGHLAASSLEHQRFTGAPGETQLSAHVRIVEAEDAVNTVLDTRNPLDILLGEGHGAAYIPRNGAPRSFAADPTTGRIHQVHVVPAMVFLRYGAIGLIAYLFLMASCVKISYQSMRRRGGFADIAIFLSVIGYLIDNLVFMAFADPFFVLTIAFALTRPCFTKPPPSLAPNVIERGQGQSLASAR